MPSPESLNSYKGGPDFEPIGKTKSMEELRREFAMERAQRLGGSVLASDETEVKNERLKTLLKKAGKVTLQTVGIAVASAMVLVGALQLENDPNSAWSQEDWENAVSWVESQYNNADVIYSEDGSYIRLEDGDRIYHLSDTDNDTMIEDATGVKMGTGETVTIEGGDMEINQAIILLNQKFQN